METTGVALIHGIETSSEATRSACTSLRGVGFKRESGAQEARTHFALQIVRLPSLNTSVRFSS